MDSEYMGRRNHNTRSLTPTTRAEENARSADGVRDDDSFFEADDTRLQWNTSFVCKSARVIIASHRHRPLVLEVFATTLESLYGDNL